MSCDVEQLSISTMSWNPCHPKKPCECMGTPREQPTCSSSSGRNMDVRTSRSLHRRAAGWESEAMTLRAVLLEEAEG